MGRPQNYTRRISWTVVSANETPIMCFITVLDGWGATLSLHNPTIQDQDTRSHSATVLRDNGAIL